MSNENVSFDTVINETTLQSTILYVQCMYVVLWAHLQHFKFLNNETLNIYLF